MVVLSAGEVGALRSLIEAPSADAQVVVRARIVLCAGRGLRRADIAREVGVSLPTVDRWLARYREHGVAGLAGAVRGRPRGGRSAPKPGGARAGETLSGEAASGSAADRGELELIEVGATLLGPVYGGKERVLPVASAGHRKGSGAVPRSVVERFIVVEAGPEAEMLRLEQTRALRNILQWLADHPKPSDSQRPQ